MLDIGKVFVVDAYKAYLTDLKWKYDFTCKKFRYTSGYKKEKYDRLLLLPKP